MGGVPNGDIGPGLVLDAVPQIGNVLVAGEGEGQGPAVDGAAAIVGDGDVGDKAAAPIVGVVVVDAA